MTTASRLTPANAPWLAAAETQAVWAALMQWGQCWFVGGAVRDSLLDRPVSDIDLATVLEPDAVIDAVRRAGLKAVPTGKDHGTITVLSGPRAFEVTTLREDVATDGRRATVAFARDWQTDARRRDFTINALYADLSGDILDCVGGLDDLAVRRVRFIGDARQRIREDALRILRFFRFSAHYGEGHLNPEGLAACADLSAMLLSLSRERVRDELRKLLLAPDPAPVVRAMQTAGCLQPILPEADDGSALARLVVRERALGLPDADRRLASLLPQSAQVREAAAIRLRFSRRECDRLMAMDEAPDLARAPLAAWHYRLGEQALVDRLLLRGNDDWRQSFDQARALVRPVFPLKGADLIARGVPKGPKVSALLRQIEQRWIDAGFPEGDAFAALVDAAVTAADQSVALNNASSSSPT